MKDKTEKTLSKAVIWSFVIIMYVFGGLKIHNEYMIISKKGAYTQEDEEGNKFLVIRGYHGVCAVQIKEAK